MKNFSHVLSEANRKKCIQLLGSESRNNFIVSKTRNKAAVLVPLCRNNNELSLLYTVRALDLKVNGGDVSFPGGIFEDSDGSLEGTALREANEEVGLSPQRVDVWGRGPEIHRTDVTVTPVLGYIGPITAQELKINPKEVSSVFTVSLDSLTSPKNFAMTKFRFGKNYVMKTPVYNLHSKRVWGLTAYITHIVLSSLVPEIYKKYIKFKPNAEKRIG